MLRTKRHVGVPVLASLGSLLVRHIRLRALNRLLYESRLAPICMNWNRPTDVKLNPMAWITSFPVAKKVISLLTDREGKAR